ncbi:hypothetical protein ACFFJI_03715 [Allobacillus sp. GCM10007491]|uniref:Uncharacterized protein n=1 Tax=Allobacillus saliphilus TaxID=2912308 RepID=A0A941CYA7_9BACI|nr:hypothetical protein [Allobacillus saliphilus]MBR7555001.1 hypothetical protein [Allobacillus saliphilus]
MLIKLFSKIYLGVVRFFIYRSLSRKGKTNFKEVHEIIEKFEKKLIEDKHLNPDLTEGPVPVYSKQSIRLVDAFVTKRVAKQEDDFYIQVARAWVSGYEKKIHKAGLITFILFLICWFLAIIFNQYMTNLAEDLLHLVLFILPFVGFIIGILGRGWKAIVLCGLNFLLHIISAIIIL